MSSLTIGILGVIALLVFLFLGVHIGAAMTLVGVGGILLITGSPKAALGIMKATPYTVTASFSKAVVPMFVLMGNFAYHSGISGELYDACYKFLSRLKGGLAVATITACAGFAAICGSASATTTTMGVVCLPEMKKYNYSDTLSCGAICAGGTLGILIPPSVGFILYGVNAEIAVGKMFMAGIIPGIILAVCYAATAVIICYIDPAAGPKGPKFTTAEKMRSLKGVIPILILFLLVLGGIFLGWFTPNEGGAIGATGAFAFMLIKRKFTMKGFIKALRDTVKTNAMVTMILIGAYLFGYMLTLSGLPSAMARWCTTVNVSRYVVLAMVLGIYAILGCFVDSLPLIVLLVPIFLPIIKALGFDPIWFGVLMVMIMELGLLTPPVGMCCYVLHGVNKDVSLGTVFKGAAPFIIPLIVAVVIVTAFPILSTWLPSFM